MAMAFKHVDCWLMGINYDESVLIKNESLLPPMPNLISPPDSSMLDEACRKAIDYFNAGQFDAAETVFRAVLQAAPQHALANYHLGLLLLQTASADTAQPYLLAALEASPETSIYWLSYIEALILSQQWESAREILALGQSHGLEGEAVAALSARLPLPISTLPIAAPPVAGKPVARRRKSPEAAEVAALIALFEQGRFAEGVSLARAMTDEFPKHGFGWKVLGALLRSQGDSAGALIPTEKSVKLLPNDAQALTNLGLVLSDLKRLKESASCHRRALAIDPHFADVHNNLGTTLKLQGRLAEAEVSYRQAFALKPDYAEAYNNLGVTLYELKRYGEAEAAYRQALAIQPNYVEAVNNLGNVLVKLLRHAEAETYLLQALVLRPAYADAHFNLARALNEVGRLDEAVSHFQQALALRPDFYEAQLNLGSVLGRLARFNEAEIYYRAILADDPNYADAYNNLGVTLRQQGRLAEAEASFRQALLLQPERPEIRSNLLFNLCCVAETSVADYLDEARQYGALLDCFSGEGFSAWSYPLATERLRVGLVSGDLRNHAVGYWLECLIAHFDADRIELIAYPTTPDFDEMSARMAPYFSAWKPLIDLRDQDAARMIHADGVHILIDASGHTAWTRLSLFAWKPAPIQVSWLGFFASTGVSEMDYLLGDPYVTPETESHHFTETVWRLPESYLCFSPPSPFLEVLPLQAMTAGHVTFGCFNNLSKMNDAVVELWAKVLRAVPGSRLFLKTKQLGDLDVLARTVHRYAALGISRERLILEGSSPRAELLASYHRVDIALDPFPYPGGTTSAEAIWMGVPLIARRGDRFLSHMGETILHNTGLADWIADNDDDYVAKAVHFAGDINRLAAIRANLRQQALASPLFDAPRFARNFEAALWGMWQKWEAKQGVSQ